MIVKIIFLIKFRIMLLLLCIFLESPLTFLRNTFGGSRIIESNIVLVDKLSNNSDPSTILGFKIKLESAA